MSIRQARTLYLAFVLLFTAGFARAQDLFDPAQLQDLELTFSSPSYWTELLQTRASGAYVPADLTVAGITYTNVGVQMRGYSSFICSNPEKKPFKIKTDAFVSGQKVMGYDSLRLNNCAGDPTFLRGALMGNLIQPYIPAAKRAFVRLAINGENWGVYVNEQQKDATWMEEWFGSNAGHRYKAIPPETLNYYGKFIASYLTHYELRSLNKPDPWLDLIQVAKVLNTTPLGPGLVADMREVFDVDACLWVFATGALFGNWDSYIGARNNWYYVEDALHGRGQMVQHDLGLSFGVYGASGVLGPTTSLTHRFNSPNRPLGKRLMSDTQLLKEYYAHVRTLLDELYSWESIGPVAQQYHDLIDAEVQADTKKNYTYNRFVLNLTQQVSGGLCWQFFPGLKEFVQERRAYALSVPEVAAERVAFEALERWPLEPGPQDPIQFTAFTKGSTAASAMELRWRTLGGFVAEPMFDDGQHGDWAAGDGIWGVQVPAQPAGSQVEAFAVATAAASGEAVSFHPSRGAQAPVQVSVRFPPQGLRITEYMYSGEDGEFLELTNTSSQPIDLAGWSLDDSSAKPGTLDLSALGVLAPGSSAVVCSPPAAAFRASWGGLLGVPILGGNTEAPLGRNDGIYLFHPQGSLGDVLRYGDERFPGTVRAKEVSASACMDAPGADNPYKWLAASLGDPQGSWLSQGGDTGSPGAWTPTACPGGGLAKVYCSSAPNSTGLPARLTAHGSPWLSDNALTLLARDLPQNQFGYFLMADVQANVPGFSGGQGVLCLGSPMVSFTNRVLATGSKGEAVFTPNLTTLPAGVSVQVGETWSFQLWYRDDNPGPTTNTSEAAELTFS